MKRLLLVLCVLAPLHARCAEAGFKPLFDGTSLEGWFGWGTEDPRKLLAMAPGDLEALMDKSLADIRQHWKAEGGELVNDGKGLYLSTRRFYGDFELRLEYSTVAGADSGVYLRGCPQVQIWDPNQKGNPEARLGSGGLWNNSPGAPGKDPLRRMDKPFGQWNSLRVVMVGEIVSVWFNGEGVVKNARMENYFDRKTPVPARGPIQLQTHGGVIRWRNLQVREIAPDEATRLLREADPDDAAFKTLFNGRDLAGWQGAAGGYEVKPGGILACKRGSGGTLLTTEEYADFVLRFEFRLPPAGNNGIAVRAPLQGDPAWNGFEIQVLDDTAPAYANLKPYQFHGSVYGLVPAHRGYLRPVGEWNYQEIRFQGSKVRVCVNGTVTVDTDLATVDTAGRDRIPQGLQRPQGFLGLAGHNDPVEFRRIEVRRL